jgi:hypothetical protein
MLLNDFDDVDKYMAHARMLFTNVTDLRTIETDFSFLSENQIAAIRSFWASFYPNNDSLNQQSFRAVWEILYEMYTELRDTLASQGKGYEGMIFREVVERLQDDNWPELPYKQVVFTGLNALSVVEEKLMTLMQKKGMADFYWDYASAKVTDPNNKASHFAERNQKLFASRFPLDDEEPHTCPEIEVIGIPSGIGQAKHVYTFLQEIQSDTGLTDEEALHTAIILPDEHLLIPVLNSIPESIRHINVTMGYPLAGAPIASLMEYIPALQRNVRYVDGRPLFYFRDVLPLLNHRYIVSTAPEVIPALVRDIVQYNKILVGADVLHKTPFLTTLFTPIEQVEQASDYLIRLLLPQAVDGKSEPAVSQPSGGWGVDIESEFVFHYYTLVNRMKERIQASDYLIRLLLPQAVDGKSEPAVSQPSGGWESISKVSLSFIIIPW